MDGALIMNQQTGAAILRFVATRIALATVKVYYGRRVRRQYTKKASRLACRVGRK